jgi:CMP/dCMP kinase
LKKLVIAIDGPAASGKSTTARLLAKRLGYLYVDTGAMYRAMTLKVLQQKIPLDQTDQISELARKTEIRLRQDNDDLKVFLDNQDVTGAIRSPAVTRSVSAVSMIPVVREVMVREQQQMGKEGGIVVEGRDIGTVVFPGAQVKIFMDARVEERARRRQQELKTQQVDVTLDELVIEIQERDRKDTHRTVSPLRRADDAVVLDTSQLTIAQQVEAIYQEVQKLMVKG